VSLPPPDPVAPLRRTVAAATASQPAQLSRSSSGATIRIDVVAVGDCVAVHGGTNLAVVMHTYRTPDGSHEFVRGTTASGAALTATPGLYVFVAGKGMVAAGAVRLGDELHLGGAAGALTPVVALARLKAAGMYNPQTLGDSIVVDGMVARTHATVVQTDLAHLLLSPLRTAFRAFDASTAALEARSKALAALAPRCAPVVDAL
jgi:hypothetical protein